MILNNCWEYIKKVDQKGGVSAPFWPAFFCIEGKSRIFEYSVANNYSGVK